MTLTVSVLVECVLIHYCYGEQKTILSELVLIIIIVFPRILILVQNILIYLLEILNTILQGWRHCYIVQLTRTFWLKSSTLLTSENFKSRPLMPHLMVKIYTLIIQPTGQGKSLCYQCPAMYIHWKNNFGHNTYYQSVIIL